MSEAIKELTKNRTDLSQFLVHLTRNGTFEVYTEMGDGFYDFPMSAHMTAKENLEKILRNENPQIEARSPVGLFKYNIDMYSYKGQITKKRRGSVDPNWLKCVCFSETPLRELRHIYKATVKKRNQYQKYGLAFRTNTVRNKGGNPVLYVDSRPNKIPPLLQIVQGILDSGDAFRKLLPFFETFGPPVLRAGAEIDFRWEREWRVPGNFNFTLGDVAFGMCPDNEIPEFEKLSKGVVPFIDPDWDDEMLEKVLKEKNCWKLLTEI